MQHAAETKGLSRDKPYKSPKGRRRRIWVRRKLRVRLKDHRLPGAGTYFSYSVLFRRGEIRAYVCNKKQSTESLIKHSVYSKVRSCSINASNVRANPRFNIISKQSKASTWVAPRNDLSCLIRNREITGQC